ncbi:MAG: PAS domain S-box protein [Deltaproteobacteria bacterium]|nr:PAS domain S-box protein [Deltaproteobacteria bacterium]
MDGSLPEDFEKLALHDHIGLFYRDSEDRLSALFPYLRIGLSRREKCLLYCAPSTGEEILTGLKRKGIDVGIQLARGALLVTQGPASRSSKKEGFEPQGLVAFFRSAVRLASAEKYAGLRLCVDMRFALGTDFQRDRLPGYQWMLHAFLAEQKCLCLCLHGMEDFPPEALLDALRAHPFVIFKGKLVENFYCVPPTPDSGKIDAARVLREQLDHLVALQGQLSRMRGQAIRITRFRDIAASLLAHEAMPDLLRRIVEGVVSLGYRMCWIGMARLDGAVEPISICGDKEGYLQEIRVRWDDSPLANGPTGAAIRKGKPDVIRDVARSHRFAPWRESALARGYQSVAALPLREGKKVIGALTVYASSRDAFDREAIEELSAFVLQASLVLQSAKEYRRLSLSEERLRTLFEQIPAACFTYDRDGEIRHWNLHCRRLFGYAPKEAEGKSVYRLIARPGDEQRTREILSRVFSGESFFNLEWEYRTPAGESRWVLSNTYPFRGKGDAVELGISVNIDITRQVEDRRALAESEERYRAVVEDANVFAVELDPEGKTVLFNRTAERITGYRPEEVLGKDYFSLLIPERERERVAESFRGVLAGKEAVGFVNPVLTRDGEERTISWNATAIRDAEGAPCCVVALGIDITKRLHTEREKEELRRSLSQAQKMEAVGAVAGGIAHEFNNILGAIIGYSTLLQSRMKEDDPYLETVEKIYRSAERAAQLTAKLIGFARRGKYLVRPLSLNELVTRTVPVLASSLERSIEIRTLLEPSLAAVEGDAGQLQHSLLDLCFNARDAMPEGGTLTIETGNARLSAEEARRYHVAGPGEYAYIEVRDTGEGMTEEVRKHIFEPFFTTRREKGYSGMGLPMVYGIVKNHKGGIHVESAPGAGSAFRIYLPATESKEIPKALTPAEPYPKGTEKILIVDDEPEIREMGCALLRTLGYRTLVAEDGAAACRLFREGGEAIDLVLLDIMMPKMGGRETFRELRRLAPGLPVLLSSGYTVEGLAQEILNEGANGFIQKPYGLSELARTIRRILDAGQTATGA